MNELTSLSLLATAPSPVRTAPAAISQESTEWRARLELGFAARNAHLGGSTGSYLKHRRHFGPLRVQRPLYPEGQDICHAVIVHPPGGVAGGDCLHIDIDVGAHSHAVLATPGATKWYKSNHRSATQTMTLRVGDGARLDWLPQNNIVFDDAVAKLTFTAEVAPTASAIGWETTQLGRQISGERWHRGQLQASTTLKRPNGELLWTERAVLDASDPIREAQQGLGGWNAYGTLWAIAATADPMPALLEALNDLLAFDLNAGEHGLCAGVTQLPNGVILIRAVARRMETLQNCFIQCWGLLRPAMHGVPPRPLRIWTT